MMLARFPPLLVLCFGVLFHQAFAQSCTNSALVLARIIGGVDARLGEIPWQARLVVRGNLCGATIVNEEWLITAAHCLLKNRGRQISPMDLEIHIGSLEMSRLAPGEQVVTSDYLVVHPLANLTTADYDFGLIHLTSPLTFSETVKPACLFSSCDDEPAAGSLCVISGWGAVNLTVLTANEKLQKSAVPLVSLETCQNAFLENEETNHVQLTDRMICAGYPTGGRDTCQGDSGGPLVCQVSQRTGNLYLLAGITSFGYSCGTPGLYGVYSRPCKVANWIQRVIDNAGLLPSTTMTTSPSRITITRSTRRTPTKVASTITRPSPSPISTISSNMNSQNDYGCSTSMVMAKVTGGVDAKAGELPWQARLIARDTLCGATIISDEWLITAAHCLLKTHGRPISPDDLQIRVGSLQLSRVVPGEHQVTADYFVTHPLANLVTADYDFALIHLSAPLTFTSTIKPACLLANCSEEVPDGSWCVISGWGAKSPTPEEPTDKLQKAFVPLVSLETCQNAFLNNVETKNVQLTDRMLCAGHRSATADTCLGDSGGPLICLNQGSAILSGITSFGFSCGQPGLFGAYSRPCRVADWIQQVTSSAGSPASNPASATSQAPTPRIKVTVRHQSLTAAPNNNGDVIETMNCTPSKAPSVHFPSSPSQAVENEFPWQVKITARLANSTIFSEICGGAIIANRWILTSAQCFRDNRTVLTVQSSVVSHPTVIGTVVKIVRHPSFYSNYSYDYDFALIKLLQRINSTSTAGVGTICLPDQCNNNNNAIAGSNVRCVTSGWESISSMNFMNRLLMKATVKVMNYSDCRSSLGNNFSDRLLCATLLRGDDDGGNHGKCQTDLGGPLVCQNRTSNNNKWKLEGVASFAPYACTPTDDGSPDLVYSRICSVSDWIAATIASS